MAASASPSVSPSRSPSISPSASRSPSISPSRSPSISPSASPSYGYQEENVYLSGAAVGDVLAMNIGKTDDETPIYYELETQELEFGNRIIKKSLQDKMLVFSENAADSKLQITPDEKNAINIDNINLGKRVAHTTLPVIEANFVTIRWYGNATQKSPVLEGFYFNNVQEKGII